MFRNVTQIIETIEGKEIQLQCDMNCTTAHLKEFLFRCLKLVGNIEDAQKVADEVKKEAESKIEPEVSKKE